MGGNQQSGVQACLCHGELWRAVTERMQLRRLQGTQALTSSNAGCRLCAAQTFKMRAKCLAVMPQGGPPQSLHLLDRQAD